MVFFDKNFMEIFTYEIMSLIGGLIAGIALAAYTNKLLLIPGMLMALPGFLEMRGNISGSLASRLSSGLFLGVLKERMVNGNVTASVILAVIGSFALGIFTFLFNYLVFGIVFTNIIFIFIIAGIIANLIEIPLTVLSTFYLFSKGHDPNNILGPILTSTGDISSIISLLIAVVII